MSMAGISSRLKLPVSAASREISTRKQVGDAESMVNEGDGGGDGGGRGVGEV